MMLGVVKRVVPAPRGEHSGFRSWTGFGFGTSNFGFSVRRQELQVSVCGLWSVVCGSAGQQVSGFRFDLDPVTPQLFQVV